jgi:uncharacterized membrane protein YGL010W
MASRTGPIISIVGRLDGLLEEYGACHRSRGNLLCHAVGITSIVFGILSMLHALPVSGLWTASEVLVALAVVVYVALDPLLGAAAARAVGDWRVGAAAFAVGWIFQGIGHAVFEKNSPAFLRNLVHLLVGPAYLVHEALRLSRKSSGPLPGD